MIAGDLLIFKFNVWDPTGKVPQKTYINCVPATSLKIGTSLYRTKTSVQTVHYKQAKTAGISYISIVSVIGKWLHCQNKTLSFVQWPKGGRDMFLGCTSVNSDSGKTSKLHGSKVAIQKC